MYLKNKIYRNLKSENIIIKFSNEEEFNMKLMIMDLLNYKMINQNNQLNWNDIL